LFLTLGIYTTEGTKKIIIIIIIIIITIIIIIMCHYVWRSKA